LNSFLECRFVVEIPLFVFCFRVDNNDTERLSLFFLQ
jgi:hypothetical protein